MRVAVWEAQGGLRVNERAAELAQSQGFGDFIGRRRVWSDWYRRSHVVVLDTAVKRLHSLGITTDSIMETLARGAAQPWTQNYLLR